MAEHGLRGLPVLAGTQLVGMFTATDALHARQQGLRTVQDVMATDLVLAYPSDSLHTALQRMARAGVSRLPVVEREQPARLVGILTTRDLAAALDLEVTSLAARPASRWFPASDDPLRSIPVQAAMSRQFETMAGATPLTRVANRLAASGQYAVLVVDDAGVLAGIATLQDVVRAASADQGERTIGSIATRHLIVARPNQSVADAVTQPGAEALRQLPVVEERDGKPLPVGLLRRSDVVAAYLRGRDRQALIARRAHALAAAQAGEVITLDLAVGPNGGVAGYRLAELHLGHEALITAVLRDGAVLIPRGQLELQPGDRVQVLATPSGREAALQRFGA
jgi:CBS domain-containing protein